MKEERMLILNMLKDGQINTDEACKLLAAIGSARSEGELGGKVSAYAGQIKNKVTKIAKTAQPKVKKYADVVGEKLDDIKTELKNKKGFTKQENDIIIDEDVDESQEDIVIEEAPENEDEN